MFLTVDDNGGKQDGVYKPHRGPHALFLAHRAHGDCEEACHHTKTGATAEGSPGYLPLPSEAVLPQERVSVTLEYV